MEPNKTIVIKCSGADLLPWTVIKPFQGNLKDLSKENYQKLKKSILELGFSEPCSVWANEDTVWALNCHQRLRVIKQMVEEEGYTCPPIPVNYIQCENEADAKRKVLALTSQYGEMTDLGLHEFMVGAGIDLTYIKDSFRFPEIKLTEFELNFFKDPVPPSDEPNEESDKENNGETSDDEADVIPDRIEPRVKPGETYRIGSHTLYNGDCLAVLKTLSDNSFESLVTDPPAGISFMGKEWDEDKGGSKHWIEWLSQVMKEALRVLKPGAHGLVWAIPRTSHWTASALENAGFEIRDVITHLFGSGFPKSHDISKAIDKQAGAEREIIGPNPSAVGRKSNKTGGNLIGGVESDRSLVDVLTAPSTPEAKQWEGWGTALKPASEHWILVRKPTSEDTVAANVLKYGTGGINIDASRVGLSSNENIDKLKARSGGSRGFQDEYVGGSGGGGLPPGWDCSKGRFPANLLLSHNSDCVEVGSKKVKGTKPSKRDNPAGLNPRGEGLYGTSEGVFETTGYASEDGTETVAAFECTEGCAVAALDEQSGNLHPGGQTSSGSKNATSTFGIGIGVDRKASFKDSGGASRFFYCAKPSKSEKNLGCEDALDGVEIINISCGPWENADLKVQLRVDMAASQEKVISASGTWNSNASEWNTLLFGNDTLDLSKVSSKSTTKTKTNLITESKILNWLAHSFTNVSTQDVNSLTVIGGSLAARAKSLSMFPSTIKDPMDFVMNVKSVPLNESQRKSNFNGHPTVKSTKLMSYLIKMVTPPDGVLLDCFGGSGTTMIAAGMKGFSSVLIEQSPEYCDIILARAEHLMEKSAVIHTKKDTLK